MMMFPMLFKLEQMSTSLDVVPIGTNHLPKCHWAFCYKLLATAGNADDVRLTPTSGGKADIPKPTLWANFSLMHRNKFDEGMRRVRPACRFRWGAS
jgi:hypothetical protein